MGNRFPICALVESRMHELGLRRSEFARRLGYKNIEKAMKRIDGFIRGNIQHPSAPIILTGLSVALELDQGIIDQAMRATAAIIAEAEQQAGSERRAAFRPCAWLVGTKSRPTQITIYGLTGGAERWLKITLNTACSPASYARQALAVARNTPVLAFHGKTVGFIVNYDPDHAIQFDLDGNPIAQLDGAYSPGQISLFLGSRPVDVKALAKLLD